ncbi:MAG: helix-turn-helix domain-containing protein [Thermoplasmata archaeon]|nr:MAG: helix-turn-helix domain-containing protein [Thermoplasmata archaeon]
MTLEVKLYENSKKEMQPLFEKIHSYEILDALKIDYEEGICVDLIEFHLKEGVLIDDIKTIGKMEIMSILKSEGVKHTCLVKYTETEDSRDLFKETDLDLISSIPSVVSEDKVTVTFIGENENLKKFIDMVKTHAGEIVNMSFKRAVYEKHDILSILTDKQRDILLTAHKHGYYEYPRKINTDQLSKKVDISKATFVQHLRKAEGRILDEILTGQPE